MNDINELKQLVLKKSSTLNVKTIDEFYDGPMPNSMEKPIVCVYLKSLNSSDSVLNDLLVAQEEQTGNNSTYCKKAIIHLGVNVYCKTACCDKVFTDLATMMLFDEDINAKKICCVSMEYKADLKAYLLEADMEIEKLMTITKPDELITGFSLSINYGKDV